MPLPYLHQGVDPKRKSHPNQKYRKNSMQVKMERKRKPEHNTRLREQKSLVSQGHREKKNMTPVIICKGRGVNGRRQLVLNSELSCKQSTKPEIVSNCETARVLELLGGYHCMVQCWTVGTRVGTSASKVLWIIG